MTEFTTSLNIGCLHLIIENGLNLKLSIILSSLFAVKLILVPVSVPYGIDLQYPHSTDADCSWLHHTPKYNYSKFFLFIGIARLYLKHRNLFLYFGSSLESSYSMILSTNSRNLLAYWSGRTVEISAPAPCLTVLAACAVRFFTP